MSDELKPCPFCGGEAHTHHAMGEVWHHCHCGSLDMHRTLGAATEAWNRRTLRDEEGLRDVIARIGICDGWRPDGPCADAIIAAVKERLWAR